MNYLIKKDYSKFGYNQTAFLSPDGIVIHEPAAPGWTDERLQDYFDDGADDRHVCAHVGIDWDSITEMVPLTRPAYHAGAHANYKYLGAELCRPKTHDVGKFTEVWNRSVYWAAHLFVDGIIPVAKHGYKITKENVLSHAEVSLKWPKDTNHVDPVAYFKEYGKTMDDFRAAVQVEIDAQRRAIAAKAPMEAIVGNAIKVNIITDGSYWLQVLNGTRVASSADVKVILARGASCKSNIDCEVLAAALRASIITDISYWGAILAKKAKASKADMNIILQRASVAKGAI